MKWAFWILVVLVILVVLAIKYLPWWALILLLVGGGLSLQWAVKFGLRQALLLPFKAKSKVLKNAALQVHRVQPIAMPELGRDPDMLPEVAAEKRARYHQLKWYSVDVSISPVQAAADTPFTAWEPSALLLVAAGSKVNQLDDLLNNSVSAVHDYEVYTSDRFGPDLENKYLGSQRLKFRVGIESGVNMLQFRYYLEVFGTVDFPDRSLSAQPMA